MVFLIHKKLFSAAMIENDIEHSSYRLGCAPEELVTDGERGQELGTEVHLTDTADGNRESSGNRRGRKILH